MSCAPNDRLVGERVSSVWVPVPASPIVASGVFGASMSTQADFTPVVDGSNWTRTSQVSPDASVVDGEQSFIPPLRRVKSPASGPVSASEEKLRDAVPALLTTVVRVVAAPPARS